MSERRAQGRPARGSDEVGRDKIVNAMRDVMRINWRGCISRKDLAAFTGITPALVSYYFPKRPILIAAATVPVIQAYEAKIREIAASDDSEDNRMFGLISALVDCYGNDGGIVESFREFITSAEAIGIPDYAAAMHAHSLTIVEAWLDANPTCRCGPEFVQAIIWGVCKAISPQAEHLSRRADLVSDDAVRADAVTNVMQMLTRGLLGATSPVEHVAKRHLRQKAKAQSRPAAGDFAGKRAPYPSAPVRKHSDAEEWRH